MPASARALVTYGGWEGHSPREMAAAAEAWLAADGFSVEVTDDLDAYTRLGGVDLVVQAVTMGELGPAQEAGLTEAVRRGMGLAGWHGGLCDSFRASTGYQFLTGGQWVAHPGGSEVTYRVDIADAADPITAGLESFTVTGEQYYLHVDPSNHVLATTMFAHSDEQPGPDGAVVPVVYTRRWGDGRIAYASFGHGVEELAIPEVTTILRRALRWAARA